MTPTPMVVLLVDDDEDDRMLARDALSAGRPADTLFTVEDGYEAIEFLRREGRYASGDVPTPAIILLDLNMPGKDGRELLRELKTDAHLRHIPIVVLSTSCDDADVYDSYHAGTNSYITKPGTFAGLIDVMQSLGQYWFQTVDLPEGGVTARTAQ